MMKSVPASAGGSPVRPSTHRTRPPLPVAVDRLLEKGLASRCESSEDRRVRIVALTQSGKDLIVPTFRKHATEIGRAFADASPKELAGMRARTLFEQRGKQD